MPKIPSIKRFSGISASTDSPIFTGDFLYESRVSGETFPTHVRKSGTIGRPSAGIDRTASAPEKERTVQRPYLDAAVTGDEDGTLYLSLVNRDPEPDRLLQVDFFGDPETITGLEFFTVTGEGIYAFNTKEHPDAVTLRKGPAPEVDGSRSTFCVPAHSVNVVKFKRG